MDEQKKQAVAIRKFQEETVGQVLAQVESFQETGELVLPDGYAVGNALKSAWLILLETKDRNDNAVLDICSKESICNTLLEMTVMGLSPMKKQCAFIAYGNKLKLQIQYQGNIALAKRFGDLTKVFANVIYDGDVFEYGIDQETGTVQVLKHELKLENINPGKIKGAYATTILGDGTKNVEVMNMAQIQKAWEQGPMKGKSPAHKNFPDQMCLKTVINRAVKLLVSTSDDSALSIAKQDPVERPPIEDADAEQIVEEIKTEANAGEEISIDDTPKEKVTEEKKKPEQQTIVQPRF